MTLDDYGGVGGFASIIPNTRWIAEFIRVCKPQTVERIHPGVTGSRWEVSVRDVVVFPNLTLFSGSRAGEEDYDLSGVVSVAHGIRAWVGSREDRANFKGAPHEP